jgi:hypothetical protein
VLAEERDRPFFSAAARRLDLQRASPYALVRGYGHALAEVLGELSTDLQVVAE